MDNQQLRNLKHDLRTPLNHILGYSELLLEAATDACDDRVLSKAENLQHAAQSLARAIEKALASSERSDEEKELARLRVGLRPRVEELLELAKPSETGLNSYNEDLMKISQAAERLLDLVHGRKMAAQ